MVVRLKRGETVRRTERNGLPIYHVTDDGPARAGLMFRVGRGDEWAASAGSTHLVEHLGLFPFGQTPYQYNGLVDAIRTVFVVSGGASEIVQHLVALTRNLAALPLDRLETEQRVLRDEAGRRSVGPPDYHAWLRWGLHGPGLAFIPEFGLWRLSAAEVQGWSTAWFNVNNAALVWAGPKLPAFDLSLPDGDRLLPSPLAELVDQPVWAVGGTDQVALSFALKRDTAGAAAQRILGKRLQQRLRYERGLSYDISLQYQPLSAELAISTLWASCAAQDAVSVRDVVANTMQELANDGPTTDELAGDLDLMRRARAQPFTGQGEADRQAVQHLLGAPPETLEQLETELSLASPADVASSFGDAMKTAILTQPNGVGAPAHGFKQYPALNAEVLQGRRFRNRWQASRGTPTLVVGDEGVSLAAPNGTGAGIRYRDVAVAVRHSKGLLAILHENGAEIDIEPRDWRDGNIARDLAIAQLLPDRIVDIDDGPLDDGTNIRSLSSWIFLGFMGLLSLLAVSFGSFAGRQPGSNSLIAASLAGIGAGIGVVFLVVELLRKRFAPVVGAIALSVLLSGVLLFYGDLRNRVLFSVVLGLPLVYLAIKSIRRIRNR